MAGADLTVLLSNDDGLAVPLEESEIEAILAAVLDHEGVARSCEVSVTIADEDEIQGLNQYWRGVDAPTDVLSFACDSPFDEDVPDDEPVELGDLVLCPSVIAAQAPRFGGDAASEFRLMLVHGALHLLGYDHVDEDGAAEMEASELAVLRALAEGRGEDPDAVELGPMTRHLDD